MVIYSFSQNTVQTRAINEVVRLRDITKKADSFAQPGRNIPMKKQRLKILIVDDDPGMGDILSDLCAINGYQSELADNGAEALKLMRQNMAYDLAIVDFLMPVMSGAEFMTRAREEKAGFPIIVISGCDDVEDTFIAAGANFFLKKPFDPALLEKAIEIIAQGASRGDGSDLHLQ
jgi:DNA-binding response OmpR family regulator